MRTTWGASALALAGLVLLAGPAEAKKCKQDAVQVGNLCVDKYEASVWETTDAATIKKIQKGKIASAGDLGTATQHGASSDDYGVGCPDNAAGCKDFYAVSVFGVTPSAYLTQIQATAACRNAGKRLLTNGEWTAAALGTPDPGTDDGTNDCNVGSTFTVASTGSRSSCVSDTGNFDMVGNLWEWVADWGDRATGSCTSWSATYGSDYSCVGGNSVPDLPGALIRGGGFSHGSSAGVFAVYAFNDPSVSNFIFGFRCAREP